MQSNKVGYCGTKNHTWTILTYIGLILFSQFGLLFGQSDSEKPSADRSRVYKLNHRTAEQIKECLLQLGIGRRVDALSESILIVTSDKPTDLIRTSSVLQILDNQAPRSIRQWTPAETVGLPDQTYILSHLGLAEVNVGTLMDPPAVNVAQPVIVDMQGDVLLVIGDQEMISRVDSMVQEWIARRQQELPLPAPVMEPNQPAAAAGSPPSVPMDLASAAAAPKAAAEPNTTAPADQDLLRELSAVMAEQPMVEPEAAAETVKTEPNSEEDFFSAELLKSLTAAQEKAERLQGEIEAEKQKTSGAASEEQTQKTEDQAAEDQAFLEVIEALRRKSEELPEEARPAEQRPEEVVSEPAPAAAPQPAEKTPHSDLALLQEQLTRQEQQIAELKALLTERAREPEKKIRTAPQTSEPQIPEGEKELELTITLPEKVEITSLLELVGKQLGLNYMYDPAQVKGDVTLKIHDGKIKVKDTYALLESVLRFKGFVMTRRGNLVTIVPANQIKQAEPVIRAPDEPMEPGDVIVSSVYNLSNITPAAAQKMLTEMQLGTAFVVVAETNSLIVTDYAYRMDRINQVITLVDVAGEPRTFRYRQLQYVSAVDMVNKLKTLTAQMEGVSVASASPDTAAPTRATTAAAPVRRDSRGRVIAGQPAAPAPAAPAAAAAPSQETVYLDTDERTNRIVMIGFPAQIKTINELIDTLDVPKYYIRYVREYFIQHVEAAEIITALNELGLASVVVSGQTSPARTTTPSRAVSSRAAQPAQPPQPAVSAAQPAGGEDQPYISIRPNTNSLLVNATREQHEAIELVIMHVDVKQKDQRTIHEYEIQNVDAMQIVQTMEDLGIISPSSSSQDSAATRGGAGRTSASRQSAAQQAAQQQAGQAEMPMTLPTMEGETVTELTAAQPQIAVLESTNSLLVNATPRQHTAIALIIAHVDRTLDQISTPYVVYPLENQDPEKLAAVLNELIQETIEQAQKSSPDAKIQTTGSPSTAQLPTREEERIRIISDPASYSLIVYANKKNQQWVGELIRELDEYRPQVLLDCTLVEITKQDDFNYDLNVLHSIPDLTNTSGLTGTIIPGTTPFTKDDILDKLLAPTSDRSQFIDLQSESGSFTGFYGNDKIMALLTAMQKKRYGRIMAKPKLLVDDNQEGTIETKNTTYIERTTSTTITSDGGPLTTEDTKFEPYDAKITLNIKPHISKGDNLRLEIELIRSDFVDFDSASLKPPNQAESNVISVVTVPDGSTIILGGMDKINQSKGGDKVPILGDIPLIGGMFRSASNTSTQSKLYVFVRAYILRPGEDLSGKDLRQISNKYRFEFNEKESEMQVYEDWPGIEPSPMDPVRVLEGDEDIVSEEEALY